MSDTSPMLDAARGDVYVDSDGKLWRVVEIVHEPRVTVEEVEGRAVSVPLGPFFEGQHIGGVAVFGFPPNPTSSAKIERATRSSTTDATIFWDGFRRIWSAKRA